MSNHPSSKPPRTGGSFVVVPSSGDGPAPESEPAPFAGAPVSPSAPRQVLDPAAVQRAITRMAHEIVERNHGVESVVLVGLAHGGIWLAEALGAALSSFGSPVPVGSIDVSFFRDDLGLRAVTPTASSLDFELHDRVVVLVDDVLYTGRTVRAALDALREYGRPRSVQLAVLVDRGHRELPIRPDFVGKNLPTSRAESVLATAEGVEIR